MVIGLKISQIFKVLKWFSWTISHRRQTAAASSGRALMLSLAGSGITMAPHSQMLMLLTHKTDLWCCLLLIEDQWCLILFLHIYQHISYNYPVLTSLSMIDHEAGYNTSLTILYLEMSVIEPMWKCKHSLLFSKPHPVHWPRRMLPGSNSLRFAVSVSVVRFREPWSKVSKCGSRRNWTWWIHLPTLTPKIL